MTNIQVAFLSDERRGAKIQDSQSCRMWNALARVVPWTPWTAAPPKTGKQATSTRRTQIRQAQLWCQWKS